MVLPRPDMTCSVAGASAPSLGRRRCEIRSGAPTGQPDFFGGARQGAWRGVARKERGGDPGVDPARASTPGPRALRPPSRHCGRRAWLWPASGPPAPPSRDRRGRAPESGNGSASCSFLLTSLLPPSRALSTSSASGTSVQRS
ncbi:unnamed protein product [Prorocentrum cordatum]|uniref:Uncharacterized protein n=1 Tax=Prorocentrum cordatum TaxID=2364126 RepID=A0ABN9X4F4_9DINO|nr:unnamed protein product [Polarella glacialis]